MSTTPKASDIAQTAVQVGSISKAAAPAASRAVAVAGNVDTGIKAGKLEGSRQFVVNAVVDNSESMKGKEKIVRESLAMLRDELTEAMEEGGVEVLICIYLLHGGMIQPYCLVDEMVTLDDSNHVCDGGTPLYRRTFEILGTLLQKVAELSAAGRIVQSYTVLISDGEPTDGPGGREEQTFDPAEIASVVRGMVEAKQHIVSAIHIGSGHDVEESELSHFKAMGIDRKWILDPKDEFGFKEAMAKVSRASRSASRGAGAFRTAANEGFR